MLTGQECGRSRRQQALHCGHSGKGGRRGRRVATGLRGYGACEAAVGVVQKSGEKDESSRSGTLTFNMTHASERGAAARKSQRVTRIAGVEKLSVLVSHPRATRPRGLAYLPNEMVMYYRVVRPYKTLQYGPVCHGLHRFGLVQTLAPPLSPLAKNPRLEPRFSDGSRIPIRKTRTSTPKVCSRTSQSTRGRRVR